MAAIIAVYPNAHNCVTLRGDMNSTPEDARDHLPAGIVRSISREDLANLPINRYHGAVHLVASQHEIGRAHV